MGITHPHVLEWKNVEGRLPIWRVGLRGMVVGSGQMPVLLPIPWTFNVQGNWVSWAFHAQTGHDALF